MGCEDSVITRKKWERVHLPVALAVAAYAVYSAWYGPWDAFSLVCVCGLSVSGARVLQPFLVPLLQQYVLQKKLDSQLPTVGEARNRGCYTAAALAALLLVQVLVSPDTPWLLISRWYLLVFTPLLAVALEFVGSPRAELSEALADSQTNYAQGAAWSFFLGYLMIIFGHGHGKAGEDETPSFSKRMGDYLASHNINDEEQEPHLRENPVPCKTYKSRMLLLVPMKQDALLNDKDFSEDDSSVTKEKKLDGIMDGGRPYGQTQVYTIKKNRRRYRVAMEEATPIRTASLAVDDAAAENFDGDDFEEFARRFVMELRKILKGKPLIGDQVEVVPIKSRKQLGATVADHIEKLMQQEAADGGSSEERQPPSVSSNGQQ